MLLVISTLATRGNWSLQYSKVKVTVFLFSYNLAFDNYMKMFLDWVKCVKKLSFQNINLTHIFVIQRLPMQLNLQFFNETHKYRHIKVVQKLKVFRFIWKDFRFVVFSVFLISSNFKIVFQSKSLTNWGVFVVVVGL